VSVASISHSPKSINSLSPLTEEPEEKTDWSRRFVDPHIRMKWNSGIQVIPADSENGLKYGTRIYPDGTTERYEVNE
jgi:hypothetical protein